MHKEKTLLMKQKMFVSGVICPQDMHQSKDLLLPSVFTQDLLVSYNTSVIACCGVGQEAVSLCN